MISFNGISDSVKGTIEKYIGKEVKDITVVDGVTVAVGAVTSPIWAGPTAILLSFSGLSCSRDESNVEVSDKKFTLGGDLVILDVKGDNFSKTFDAVLRQEKLPEKPILIKTDRKFLPEEIDKLWDEIVRAAAEYLIDRHKDKFTGLRREEEIAFAKKVLIDKFKSERTLDGPLYLDKGEGDNINLTIPEGFRLELPDYVLDWARAQAKYLALSPYALFRRASELASLDRDYQKAISQLEDVAQRCGSESDLTMASYLRIGVIYDKYLYDFDKAIEYYQKVVDARPQTPWAAHALFEIGKIRVWKLGQSKEGIKAFDQITTFPDNTIFVEEANQLKKEAIKRNTYSESIHDYVLWNECATQSIDSPDPCMRVIKSNIDSKARAQAHYYLGNYHYERFEFDEALKNYKEFINNGDNYRIKGNAFLFAGLSSIYLGDTDEAIDYLTKAQKEFERKDCCDDLPIRFFPPEIGTGRRGLPIYANYVSLTRAYINYLLGDLYLSIRGGIVKANEYFENAKKTGSGYYPLLSLLVNAYAYKIGDPEKALNVYGISSFDKGQIYRAAKNDNEKAIKEFSKVIADKRDDNLARKAFLAIGYIYLDEKKYEDARKVLGKIKENSAESYLASFLLNVFGIDSRYELAPKARLNHEIAVQVCKDKETRETDTLVFVHDLPVTYVPGKVRLENNILKVEYDQGFKVKFIHPEQTIYSNNLIVGAIEKFPLGLFNGKVKISFVNYHHIEMEGMQPENTSRIIIFPEGAQLSTLLHELSHYYDHGITGDWLDPFDESLLYGKINFYQIGSDYKTGKYNRADFSNDFFSHYFRKSSSLWQPSEDFAYFMEDYWDDRWSRATSLMQHVRGQMGIGNFNPALKYLFAKHLTPFRDKVDDRSPSLGFGEVEGALSGWKGRKIDESVAKIFNEIKSRSEKKPIYTCEDKVYF